MKIPHPGSWKIWEKAMENSPQFHGTNPPGLPAVQPRSPSAQVPTTFLPQVSEESGIFGSEGAVPWLVGGFQTGANSRPFFDDFPSYKLWKSLYL